MRLGPGTVDWLPINTRILLDCGVKCNAMSVLGGFTPRHVMGTKRHNALLIARGDRPTMSAEERMLSGAAPWGDAFRDQRCQHFLRFLGSRFSRWRVECQAAEVVLRTAFLTPAADAP